MQEIWKDIKGFEGRYQVSNFGRVKSIQRKVNTGRNGYRIVNESFIKPRNDKTRGYQTITFRIYPKRYTFSLHRLVAENFIPNPNNFPEVNHKDSDPANNKANNLEWCNQRYNIKYAYKYGNAKPTSGCFKKGNIPHNLKKINQYSKNNQFIKTFNSIKEASTFVNTARSNITNCLTGKTKTAKGFIWKYAE